MKLFVDINTGTIRTSISSSPIRLLRLYRGNVLPLSLVLVDGSTIVTSDTIIDSISLQLAIAGFTRGAQPLVEQDEFTLAGEVATGSLDLSGDDLADYFTDIVPANTPQWMFKMEIQAVSASGSFRQTFYSGQAIIVREILPFNPITVQAITDNDGNVITDNEGGAITDN